MNATLTALDHYAGLLAGIAGILLGLAMVLFSKGMSERVRFWLGTLVLATLCGGSIAAVRWWSAPRLGVALAVLAVLWSVGWLLRSRDTLNAILRRLASPSLQAVCLLVAGIPVATAWCHYLDARAETGMPARVELIGESLPTLKDKRGDAFTDQGTPIPLYRRVERAGTLATDAENMRNSRIPSDSAGLIKTAGEDPITNCHGWLFTNGRYWVNSRDVSTILKENGYREVTEPRAGDVIVYFDVNEVPNHTGYVQCVTSEGLVLIESKWGYGSRFIHAAGQQGYSTQWNFFRSAREGHLLRGIDGTPAYPENVSPSAGATPAT